MIWQTNRVKKGADMDVDVICAAAEMRTDNQLQECLADAFGF